MSTDNPWPTPLPSAPEPAPGERVRPDLRDDIRACAATTLMGVVSAFAVGALWRWISPPVTGVYSQHVAFYAAPESKTFIARDGWFALFACIAAVLLAVFAFVRHRGRGSAGASVGLALGGLGASYLASWFGAIIGPGRGSAARVVANLADGAVFDLPLTVRATGVIWLWPAVAVGLFFFLMLLFGPPDQPRASGFAGWGAQEAVAPLDVSEESAPPESGPSEYGPSGSPSASI
jgi:hypothetical protein